MAEPLSKEARQAERARRVRMQRLPFLYAFAQRGRWQGLVATLAQAVLPLLVLPVAKLVTGDWLPPGVAVVVLAVSVAQTLLSSYLNAKAGRM